MGLSVNTSHVQETKNAGRCGPAALKIVLDYFDTPMTEDELADLCGTHPENGTTGAQLVAAAKLLGYKATIKDGATYADIEACLRRKVPPIVDWFSAEGALADGHYSVVCGLDAKNIVLEDPKIGKRRTLSRDDFLRVWFDYDTDVPEKKDFFVRRLIVIEPA